MRSTGREYTPGWSALSTGIVNRFSWGINSLSKGRVMAGAFIGDVTGTTGSVGTAELASQAVTSTKLGPGAMAGSNGWGTVETISTADTTLTASGTAVLTKATTGNLAVTIPAPTNGLTKSIYVDVVTANSFLLTCATTTVTFDGTNKTITFNAIADSCILQGIGTTRWAVIANNSVTIS